MNKTRAKLFRNGGSQAVRLPKTCSFPTGHGEVLIHREGRKVILEPVDEWPKSFMESLGSLEEEIPRLKQQPTSKLKDPFA